MTQAGSSDATPQGEGRGELGGGVPPVQPGIRAWLAARVEGAVFVWFMSIVIGINAIALGLETSPWMMARLGGVLAFLDTAILAIFVVEIGLKLFALGPRFFRNGWNIFDFAIVAVALIPSSGAVAVLRALRALRALRLISVVPRMRAVVTALFAAMPGFGAIVAILALIFYVAGVMATKMFGTADDPAIADMFASVGASMYTLFQVMTLEGWSGDVVRPVMVHYPWAWAFFIPFIIISSFAVLNLFLALIVNCLNMIHDEDDATARAAEVTAHGEREALGQQLQALQQEVAALRADLQARSVPPPGQ